MSGRDRLKIAYPIIVEGKYDRLRLLEVVDGQIITTEGFGIFSKKEKTALLRALAAKTKIIVLTDSDGAGKLIRSHIASCLPSDRIIGLYVPRIEGKEKRKRDPSKEGILGVEGMEKELLLSFSAHFPMKTQKKGCLKIPSRKKIFISTDFRGERTARQDATR